MIHQRIAVLTLIILAFLHTYVNSLKIVKPHSASLWSPLEVQTVALETTELLELSAIRLRLCRPAMKQAEYDASCTNIDTDRQVVGFTQVERSQQGKMLYYEMQVCYKLPMIQFSERWILEVRDARTSQILATSSPFNILRNVQPTGEADYELDFSKTNLLGEGGFGRVYKAQITAHNKVLRTGEYVHADDVAVKIVTVKDDDCWRQQHGEVSILRSARHEHVMPILDDWETVRQEPHGQHRFRAVREWVVVMPLAKGGDMHSFFDHPELLEHAIKQGHIKSIARQILEGLAYLHEIGIIHRDIKPENILFRDKYTVNSVRPPHILIADFGMSCLGSGGSDLSWRKELCGTPGYIAPEFRIVMQERHREQRALLREQLRTSDDVAEVALSCPRPEEVLPYGEKIDMWSLGMVFYYLFDVLPNKVPAHNGNYMLYMRWIDFKRPEWKDVDPKFMSLVKLMLDKDPETRPSATQALQHEYFQTLNNRKGARKLSRRPEPLVLDAKLHRLRMEQDGVHGKYELRNNKPYPILEESSGSEKTSLRKQYDTPELAYSNPFLSDQDGEVSTPETELATPPLPEVFAQQEHDLEQLKKASLRGRSIHLPTEDEAEIVSRRLARNQHHPNSVRNHFSVLGAELNKAVQKVVVPPSKDVKPKKRPVLNIMQNFRKQSGKVINGKPEPNNFGAELRRY